MILKGVVFFTKCVKVVLQVCCGVLRWTKMVLSLFTTGSEKWLQFSTQENESPPDCKEENAGSLMGRFWGNEWWNYMVPMPPWKSWFFSWKFQDLERLENHFGPGKSWKLKLKVLEEYPWKSCIFLVVQMENKQQ